MSVSTVGKAFPFIACFFVSAFLASIHIEKLKANSKYLVLLICMVVMATSAYLGIYRFIQCLVLPVFIILIGISSAKYINKISGKTGDLSYGVYLYGYVVEQSLEHLYHLSQFWLMTDTIAISACLALLSWNIIEKKALALNH